MIMIKEIILIYYKLDTNIVIIALIIKIIK